MTASLFMISDLERRARETGTFVLFVAQDGQHGAGRGADGAVNVAFVSPTS